MDHFKDILEILSAVEASNLRGRKQSDEENSKPSGPSFNGGEPSKESIPAEDWRWILFWAVATYRIDLGPEEVLQHTIRFHEKYQKLTTYEDYKEALQKYFEREIAAKQRRN
ncbi:MAG: hypothetical protein AAF990_02335 [Bacteroidota bacterium]